ncbi:MAG: ABC transporter substrate-binding protein [Candidatus Lernaella stagnicola]|nr:ABC transporter substrate-binding protein [Candidatus Lernaella stagnicola]
MFKQWAVVVFLVAIALVWGTTAGAPPQAAAPIKVGVSPVVSSAGFYLAKLRGYFDEQGVNVELLSFGGSGPEIIPFVASNQFQVGGGSVSPGMFNAIAQGNEVKIVADKAKIDPDDAHDAFLVRQDHIDSGRYRTPADLKGMTIGLASKGRTNILVIGLERMLKKHGLTLNDVELVGAPFPTQLAALNGKRIDAACSIEPFVAKAEQAKLAKRVWGYEEVTPGFQVAVVFYSPRFAKERRADAEKFMIAYIKGLRDYINAFRYGIGTESVIADLAKVLKVKDKSLYRRMRVTGFDPNGGVDKQSIAEAQDWFAAQGLIPHTVKVDGIVDDSFWKKAVEVLGDFQPPK